MKDRIAVNPQIHFGKPCVAGTRVPVRDVLELIREGISFAEIIRDHYPDLQEEDIRACIQYAIDVEDAEDLLELRKAKGTESTKKSVPIAEVKRRLGLR
jgi:uncharacterized protein (DUF433 family)